MVRPLLAFAVPLVLLAAFETSGGAHPTSTSHPATAAAAVVETGPGAGTPHVGSAATSAVSPTRAGVRGSSVPSVPVAGAPSRPAASSEPAPIILESPLFGASADVINIDPLATCLACTGSGAASGDSSSYSRSIKVADESLAEGESPANGYTSGSIVSLPPNPLLTLAIGTWKADNRHAGTTSEGHSYANAAELGVADGQVGLTLLQARSEATRDRTGQSGRASSDGAQARVGGGLTIVLLHSDASTNQPGHVYIAQVNDQALMTSDQVAGGLPPFTVPNVATISVFRGAPNRAVLGDVADSKSQAAAEVVSTSTGNTSGPRNQTH